MPSLNMPDRVSIIFQYPISRIEPCHVATLRVAGTEVITFSILSHGSNLVTLIWRGLSVALWQAFSILSHGSNLVTVLPLPTTARADGFQYPISRIEPCHFHTKRTMVHTSTLSVSYLTDRTLSHVLASDILLGNGNFQYPISRIEPCHFPALPLPAAFAHHFQYPISRIEPCHRPDTQSSGS